MAEDIWIMGDLYLHAPSSSSPLDQKWAESFFEISQEIRKLDGRNLLDLKSCPIRNISDAFQEFQKEEEQAWKAAGQRSKDLGSTLVCPSGSLKAPLAHHLHQASFMTSIPPCPEVADTANPCIAMVMGNAYRPGDTLIYDHLHRRSRKSDGIQTYPKQVLQTHQQFTYQLMESSAAKVEIVYGKPVQQEILKDLKLTALPLWGTLKDVCLFFVHENNFRNQQPGYKFRKVLLFVNHPQRMLYMPQMGSTAYKQDNSIKVAVQIADPSLTLDPTYYQRRSWQPSFTMAKQLARISDLSLRTYVWENTLNDLGSLTDPTPDDSEGHPPTNDEKTDCWEGFFDQKPCSDRDNRQLIPKATNALNDGVKENWMYPPDLPPDVADWLQGQKEALFPSVKVRDHSDIARHGLLRLDQAPPDSTAVVSLKEVLLLLIVRQQAAIASQNESSLDDLFFTRLGEVVNATCPCGAIQLTDNQPRFSCTRPMSYVAYLRSCHSKKCNPSGRRQGQLLPLAGHFEFVRPSRISLLSDKATVLENQRFLAVLRSGPELSGLPDKIELWCITCKSMTLTAAGKSVFVDSSPRWTLGSRPLLVERTPHCLRCQEAGTDLRRFIPCQPNILSIRPRTLSRFCEAYQHYDRRMLVLLLDSHLPSSRHPEFCDKDNSSSQSDTEEDDFDHDHQHPQKRAQANSSLLEHERTKEGDDLPRNGAVFDLDTLGPNQLNSTTLNSDLSTSRRSLRLPEHARSFLRLLRNASQTSNLPKEIEIWCLFCKNGTKVSNQTKAYRSAGNWLIDSNLRWTIGDPACYVSTRPKCLNCKKSCFVPKDPSIPTITGKDLRAWADRAANLSDDEVQFKFEKRTTNSIRRRNKTALSSASL